MRETHSVHHPPTYRGVELKTEGGKAHLEMISVCSVGPLAVTSSRELVFPRLGGRMEGLYENLWLD